MVGKKVLWTLAVCVLFVGAVSLVVAQPGGGPGGGRGGFGFGGPVMGKVVDGNVQQGWLSVQMAFGGRNGGDPPKVQVTLNQQSKLLKAETATLADLKVGDGVFVQGVPTALTGSQFVMGANTDATAQTMGLISGGGFRMGMGRGGGQPGQPQPSAIPQTTGQTAGLVESLEPLRVKVSDAVTVEVKAAPDASFTKLTEVPWESLEADANVLCMGQRNEDGSLTATVVTIVPELPQMGFGGAGGPGGGPGGPGGGPGGPGGGGPGRGGGGGAGGAGF